MSIAATSLNWPLPDGVSSSSLKLKAHLKINT